MTKSERSKSMKIDINKINPGPWTFNRAEHCIIDRDGNVVAEFYENDENGVMLTMLFNDKFKELDCQS